MSLLFEDSEYRKLMLETISLVYLWVSNVVLKCWNTMTYVAVSSVQLDILGSSFTKSKDISLSDSGNSFSPINVSSNLFNNIVPSSNQEEESKQGAQSISKYSFPPTRETKQEEGDEDSSSWVDTISSVCDSVFSVSPDLTTYVHLDEALFETQKEVRRGSILSNESLVSNRNSRRMTIESFATTNELDRPKSEVRNRSISVPTKRLP